MTRAFIDAVTAAHPDAVKNAEAPSPSIAPATIDALAQIVALANEHGAKLALRTSSPTLGYSLTLERLVAVGPVDIDSRMIVAQTGATMSAVNDVATSHGWSVGASSDAFESVYDWITSPARHTSKDNDPVAQPFAGAEIVLPIGKRLSIRPAPRRAVGPDLLPAVLAAGGRLGIVASVHLIARAVEPTTTVRFDFPSAEAASAALAWIRGRGVRPHQATSMGPRLTIEFFDQGQRGEAAERIVRDVVAARGGQPVTSDAPSTPPEPSKPWPLSRTLVKLAQQLDPHGVLQP